MRVLGIDCGTEKTGYGVIDTDGTGHCMIASGTICTSAKDPLSARLLEIAAALRNLILLHRPHAAAIEQVFHSINTKSALKLAHVRGVALLAVAEAGVQVGEYSPLEVKLSVVGYGRAEKRQVQLMVCSLLRLPGQVAEDASDALAVAICHATRAPALRGLEVAH